MHEGREHRFVNCDLHVDEFGTIIFRPNPAPNGDLFQIKNDAGELLWVVDKDGQQLYGEALAGREAESEE